MEIISAFSSIFVAIISIIILFKLQSLQSGAPRGASRDELVGMLNDFRVEVTNVLNSRIDSASQASNETLNRSLTLLSNELTASISRVREESRTSIERRLAEVREKLGEQYSSLQAAINESFAKGRHELSVALTDMTKDLEGRFEKLQASNEQRLEQIRQNVERRLVENIDKNMGVVRQMTAQLGDLKATNDRIVEISKDINKLSDILQSPKLRGNFGEFELETLLQQVIPDGQYDTQFSLGEGVVDVAIHLKEGMLCIDSKFPLENFRRLMAPNLTEDERGRLRRAFVNDVRRHVDAIAAKYIVPEKTLDFALMFIPAENVYYEILTNAELQDYAHSKRVIPISPNSLYAYLAVIAIGFRGMRIEQEAKRIEGILLTLKKNFDDFKERFRLVGRHLDNARRQFESANRDVDKFDATMSGLQLGGPAQKKLEDSADEGEPRQE